MGHIERDFMETKSVLTINENDKLASIRTFLSWLLSQKRVDTLLVLLAQSSRSKMAMALVNNPEMLKQADPLAPIMPRNAAQLISEMTRLNPPGKKIGVVLRPCELRDLVELVKLKQASLDNLILIGLDCSGTYNLAEYKKYLQDGNSTNHPLRKACQVCEYPSPLNADIVIGLTGTDGIIIEAVSGKGNDVLQDTGFDRAANTEISKRQTALSEEKARRITARDKLFEQMGTDVIGPDKLLDTMASCVNCHNCRVACPICYCKECFFDSPTFDWEADKYVSWSARKGAFKMPADTLLYHLTRCNHMATSCVGCGMCSEACPNDVPVFDIFRLVGSRVQKEFDYVPGRSLDEEPPQTVFKEDELKDIGR